MSEPFGLTLKRIREARLPRLSQSKLSVRAGLDHSYVSRLESGSRRPTRDAVSKLADGMQLSGAEYETLLHAAGFIDDDDPALLHDDDLRSLATVLGDPTLPIAFRDGIRAAIRSISESARFVRREIAA